MDRNKTYFILGLIVLATAGLLRALPLFQFSAWGIDFGIHAGITQTFIDSDKLYPTYSGWGASYEYFPMLYWITGGVARLLGLPASRVLPWVPLVFGGLGVLFLYVGTLSLTNRRTAAVLAGLFLATNAIHLCQTSHPYPLTMGHFFILMIFMFYFLSFKRPFFYVLMFPAGVLLVFSHHMSAYMFVIGFFGAAYARAVLLPWDRTRTVKDLSFAGFQVTTTFLYWRLLAPPLDRWVSDFFKLPLPVLIPAFIIGIAASFFLLRMFHPRLNAWAVKALDWFAKIPGLLLFAAATALWALAIVIIGVIGMGFIDVSLNPWVFVMAVPTILFLGLGITGLKYLKDQPAVLGWFLAILLSLTVAVVTWSRALFPERHLEYLVEPMAVSAGIALTYLLTKYYPLLKEKHLLLPKVRGPELAKAVPVVLVILIILGGFMSAPEAISGRYSQGISAADLEMVDYMAGNCSRDLTIATDHRLGTILNTSYGFNATFERAYWIWASDNASLYVPELEGNNSQFPRVGYVLIDDNMLNNTLVLVDNGPKGAVVTITDWEYQKFREPPFELVWRTSSKGHWAELYAVNWTYAEGM